MRSIVVVEDEAIVAEALAQRLRADGWDVLGTAGSGPRALDLCQSRRPDLVLMDVRLRGSQDGIDVAAALEGDAAPAVVFLTAHADKQTLDRAKEVRPAGYLLKPFSDAQLRVTLETAYHVRQLEHARLAADAARAHLSARLRAVLEHSVDPILAFGPEGVEFHSQSAERAFGRDGEALAGARMGELLDVGLLGEATPETVAEASRLEVLSGIRADGERFEASAAVSAVDEADLVLALVRDVSQQRAMERQVRDAQRMEAVGRVTASVAHDFNNVLSLIKGYASLVRDAVISQPELVEDLGEVLAAVEHGAALTRKLLVFARQDDASYACDLNATLQSTTRMLQRVLPPGVEVALELADEPALVRLGRTAVEQAVLNLALNARDAMPDGGLIRMETRVEGDSAILQVSDTGEGMSEEVQGRLFEPFFTTKAHGRGTGLGLAIVQSAVREAGGSIEVESTERVGSVFTLTLPVAREEDRAHPVERLLQVPSLGGLTILVIDDEGGIRRVVRRTLEPLAEAVIEAHSGVEALRVAEREVPDVVIADVVLPDLSGPVVVERLQRLNPALRVLWISGYPHRDLLADLDASGPLLQKPFGREQLYDALGQLLLRDEE